MTVKRKTVFQFGVALLSIGVAAIPGGSRISDKMVFAEEISAFESDDGFTSAAPEDAEGQSSTEDFTISEPENNAENTGEVQTEKEEKQTIILPQASISMSSSDFLPVQETKSVHSPNLYDGLYLLHIVSDSLISYTFNFNQSLKEQDIALYHFNAQNNTVDSEPVQDMLQLTENGSTLYMELNSSSDYILVISNGTDYPELSYTLKCTKDNLPKKEESALTGEKEAISEDNTVSDQESANDSETVSEEPTVTSVALNIDPDAETIPVEFLDYVNDLDIYSVMLVYADGTEKILDQTDTCYDFSASFEDASDTEGIVHRTYHIIVKDNSTGMVYNADGSIDFGKNDPLEIKTEEMTSVILENQKKWVMVQSVPGITGRYAMNCDKEIAAIYYGADGEEAVCAENVFELQQGITYNFLIKLN